MASFPSAKSPAAASLAPRADDNEHAFGVVGSCSEPESNSHREMSALHLGARDDAQLLAELSRRSRQLEILSRASQQINAVLDVPTVMRTLVASALQLADADGGTCGVMVDGKMVLSEYHHKGEIEPLDVVCQPASQRGIPSWIMREGTYYLTNDAANDAVIGIELQRRYDLLTPRERKVLTLVVTGMLNKQVAAELGISEKTIKVHRARAMEKMNVDSLAELVLIANRLGLASACASGGVTVTETGGPSRPHNC